MSRALDVPFVKGNTWDCEQLRDAHQLQRCFENRGELDADVAFYGINYDSQRHGVPLHAPYDPPGYATCIDGPTKCGSNGDFCITNVVSRSVEEKTPPLCQPGLGLVPKMIGCSEDRHGQRRSQWQCLPTWKTTERRVER
jgi:hypothetical protein